MIVFGMRFSLWIWPFVPVVLYTGHKNSPLKNSTRCSSSTMGGQFIETQFFIIWIVNPGVYFWISKGGLRCWVSPLEMHCQGCPEATAHGDIASYWGHMLYFFVRSKKYVSIQSKHAKWMKYWQLNEGIFSQNFLGEDPQTLLHGVVSFLS